jgi:DNA-binding NtrC family response regulator
MKDWQIIPEIVGCNAVLRMAALQAVDAVEHGRHFVVEGEPGTGRRLLARSVWCRRSPGTRALFTLDCRMFGSEGTESLLFGERSSKGKNTTIQLGKLNLSSGGGLLLLHAESLHLKAQGRLAQALDRALFCPSSGGVQLMMTCTPSLNAQPLLHPELAEMLMRIRVPALRERVEDIRQIAETFLRNEAPFERIRCSQALIDSFCGYEWPGNVTELRAVLRRLLLEPHNGLLDARHLAELMCRDETCFSRFQGSTRPGAQDLSSLIPYDFSSESRSMQ